MSAAKLTPSSRDQLQDAIERRDRVEIEHAKLNQRFAQLRDAVAEAQRDLDAACVAALGAWDRWAADNTQPKPEKLEEAIRERTAIYRHAAKVLEDGRAQHEAAVEVSNTELRAAAAAITDAVRVILSERVASLAERLAAARRDVVLSEAALHGLNDYFIAAHDPAGSQLVNDAIQGVKPGARRYRTIEFMPRPVTVTRRYIDPEAIEKKLV